MRMFLKCLRKGLCASEWVNKGLLIILICVLILYCAVTTKPGSRVRCLPATTRPGRRPGLSGGSRRTTTSPKASKRGDLMPGTSTTSFRAKPAAFWGNSSVQYLGLSAEETNREGEPS